MRQNEDPQKNTEGLHFVYYIYYMSNYSYIHLYNLYNIPLPTLILTCKNSKFLLYLGSYLRWEF